MEVLGALPRVNSKLGELLVGEYNLQKGVKGEIRFLQAELESMMGALEKVSNTPADQLDIEDKIWAKDLRELSYNIEDNIDTFMVHGEGNEQANLQGITKFIDRSVRSFRKTKIRHGIATEIRDIKRRLEEVAKLRDRYKFAGSIVAKPVTVDPRLFSLYRKVTELVGIEEAREEIIQILMEGNDMSKQQDKIVSIFGFGGLGKTTLAKVVYDKLRQQFECSAFVSVSRTPDHEKLLKDLLYQLVKRESNESTNVTSELREFLQKKRYFIVIDDIWDILDWEIIRCALPHNDCGSRIITTTRNLNIATGVGGAYMLKPLSLHNSKILFYKRVFGHENEAKCLDDELAEVSDKILEKCAGVPLAIITIASLLASKGRNKMEWYNVYRSIGAGLKNSLDMENMRMILLHSYYDLPPHLRACLLYLSVFPEDYDIEKDRLVRLWIGEGFIQCRKQGVGPFQIGETYFNELINRSMIQPVYGWNSIVIEFCRVHYMVFDLICSLSSEENSVTILNNVRQASPSEKVTRLSLQNANTNHDTLGAAMSMKQVRSVVVFPAAVDLMAAPESFVILRMLDLEGCHLSQGYNLEYLGNLFHLRYLGLRDTGISQLPKEIGKLRFLQTLDIRGNEISSLPSTIAHLKSLMCLLIGSWTRILDGIRNLSSLIELSTLCISDSPNTIQELGHLTELRVLSIDCRIGWKGVPETSLVGCLQKLQKIERLSISFFGECNLDGWVATQHLRRLELTGCWSSILSSWMNPSLLLNLSFLSIEVKKLQQEDLEILGRLPALTYLDLEVNHENLGILGRLVFGASSFADLVHCVLRGSIGPVVFQQGAMPRLTGLCFTFPLHEMREIADRNGGFDMGLENLKSLRDVTVSFLYGGASDGDAEKAEAALRHALKFHQNLPTLHSSDTLMNRKADFHILQELSIDSTSQLYHSTQISPAEISNVVQG